MPNHTISTKLPARKIKFALEQAASLPEKRPSKRTHWTGDCVGSRIRLDGCRKFRPQRSGYTDYDIPAHKPHVAINHQLL
jgi:hypothetical protein